jgi:hypothetical protein
VRDGKRKGVDVRKKAPDTNLSQFNLRPDAEKYTTSTGSGTELIFNLS